MMEKKPVLFSGIQPSGSLTIGNYIGALKNWVALQAECECLFSLVDLHTITVRQDPKEFRRHCYDALAIYLAAGLDPEKNIIFLQSHVPAHSQLSWILNCYTYVGELGRMTQFKDKSKKNKSNINSGLFTYPVLMAADILLYQTCLVPVGSDQKQHVELARDLAVRFNNAYGEVFTIPQVYHPPLGARIMSLKEPTKKMSKSDIDLNAAVFLLDSPDVIVNKFKTAVTDSGRDIYFDYQNKPGIANLLTILSVATGNSIEQLVAQLGGYGYSKLKSAVAESLIELLKPVQDRYKKLRGDQSYLDLILKNCAQRAVTLSQPTIKKVYEAVGLIVSKDW